ncbi:MAG TPA: FUSC family protein, partial [Ramlibacter sp.]|nr:FUSC family protein [Ramlibacter sp.]
MTPALDRRIRAALRIALSHQVLNGLSAALGLLLISAGARIFIDPFAASIAAVGAIVCIPPDRAAPRRGRFWQMLPAALFGLPLFLAIQEVRANPIALGLLLVPATFLAFLGGAWGKRGLPIAISIMLAMIFSMAVPEQAGVAMMDSGLYFALGAGLYLVWSTLSNAVLNARYRTLMMADTLLSLVALVRTQATQFAPADEAPGERAPLIGRLLREQAALADQLQTARDLLLESPRTPRRLQLAGMLLLILEMRDHLLACELDLDILKTHSGHEPVLVSLRELLEGLAGELERLTDALLLGQRPAPMADRRTELAAAPADDDLTAAGGTAAEPSPAALARGLTNRVLNINDEALRLFALARGEADPDLAVVRAAWQMFVSPTAWSWGPLAAVWRWDAPTLRHAIRAALAIASAYALSIALPWRAHDYWILLTIVVVLRGSLAQTLERRNSRVLGTLLGCLLAAGLLWGHLPPLVLLLFVSLAQALAHAFAIKKYLVTAIAATVLGLVQAHLLNAGTSPAFDVAERMADTLIGVAIAWIFSYVLPSWERSQLPGLVARTLSAQARHAR